MAQDGQPRGLGEVGTEASRRRTHQRGGLSAKDEGQVAARSAQPVDRILEGPRYRIVVFRGEQEKPVGRRDALLEGGDCWGYALGCFQISVIERYSVDSCSLQPCSCRHTARRSLHKPGVVGLLAEAAGEAEDQGPGQPASLARGTEGKEFPDPASDSGSSPRPPCSTRRSAFLRSAPPRPRSLGRRSRIPPRT